MADLFKLPKAVPIDSAGRPYPGAKAYFFEVGTSTPKDTYTDETLATPNAHPVVADANGVFAPIWLNGAYKLTLNTSEDALIYTVALVTDETLSQAELGAILYPITSAETSAGVTPTNYQYPEGYIRRYGAAVDGTTDDTAAWNAATAVCAAGGSPVQHTHGTSMAALISYESGVTYLMGANAVVKCLPSQANFSGRVFTSIGADIWDSANDSAPVVWRGGIIDGNKANQGTYTGGEKEQNHGIHLGAEKNSGGRLVARIDGMKFQNFTGDGLSIYSNVDVTVTNIEAQDCWRSGVSITGTYTKVRGGNWRLYGTATDPSDFDIEADGYVDAYGSSETLDVELSNIDVQTGDFEVSPSGNSNSHGSRILLSNVNHRGKSATFYGRGSTVKISHSVITLGPIDDQLNRVLWPNDFTFDDVKFIFSEGAVTATSTFGVDVWWNTGGTTDTNQVLRFINCRWEADSTVESGDTVHGIRTRAQAASTNNVVELDGGHFHSSLDAAYYTLQGGKLVVKGSPTIDSVLGLSLTYSSTDYWDVTVHGSIQFGPNNTTYLHVDQGVSNNVIRHFGTVMDEADNVLSDGGGSPGNNTYNGYRTIMVASAPGAGTHGNVGDRAMIKAPSASNPVEYVCVTRGVGSGASWKVLTTASA